MRRSLRPAAGRLRGAAPPQVRHARASDRICSRLTSGSAYLGTGLNLCGPRDWLRSPCQSRRGMRAGGRRDCCA
eukprot:1702347-Pyramimonas_sp.AAC.1